MYKETMGFVRGVGTGMVAGIAVASMGSKMMKNNRKLRRNANKAMHAVNGMFGDVQGMFKQ
ncbi:hypothetical protein [Caproiciproducens sp. CPB-2]|uniref:hypothetical protein n=1 Tax=unclassified Caproiciproducens TaxID=2643836 RepID=UPI0023DA2632|nr:hypothetical protein [Caproiciproducens sp. CPB-2]MDF1493369.1 hypothetical protein [Caproiciproducens sp. CPB-2]